MSGADRRFDRWLEELHHRFRSELRFSDLRKGVVALSRLYVEERSRLSARRVLGSAAKRAAFACFYAPLHFLLLREILAELPRLPPPRRIVDLGCGTGAASAAWSDFHGGRPFVAGVDLHPWAVAEARHTFRAFGIRGRASRGVIENAPMARRGEAVLLSFSVNELQEAARDALLVRLLEAHGRGATVLIVEPIARGPSPWWPEWSAAFERAGGRQDEWRFARELPPPLRELGRAAGLDPKELLARTLALGVEARPPARYTISEP